MEELRKELEARGTAELSEEGIVTQVTQAIEEKDGTARMLVFGEMTEYKYKPIDEVCAVCKEVHFGSIKACQEAQAQDARARGFTKIICPNQFIKGESV